MISFLTYLDEFVRSSLLIFVTLMEISATFIILNSAASVFINFLRTNKDGYQSRLTLARHLAFALEFVLGAEILRTIIARTWNELAIVSAVIILRSGLTLLIHWEIKQENLEEETRPE